MGENCRSLPTELHFDWQSPYLNSLGQKDIMPESMNPSTHLVSPNGTLPVCASSIPPQLWEAKTREPHGWLNGLPSIQQAFMPTSNFFLKDKLSIFPHGGFRETVNPNVDSGHAQKRFLVVDQSGDQTTLIFSSGIGAPAGCLTSLNANPHSTYNFNEEGTHAKSILKNLAQPIPTNEGNQSNENGVQSEMHEDTEELNALIYSDDATDSSEDDEVTSTGHSPSTITATDKHNWFQGCSNFDKSAEVASSAGTTKRRKLFNGCYDRPFAIDTASSVKHSRSFEFEDEAESCCASKNVGKEKIRQTVSILQNIIPGGKGKDAMLVLDEAIQYLKLLKHQAKTFGYDAL